MNFQPLVLTLGEPSVQHRDERTSITTVPNAKTSTSDVADAAFYPFPDASELTIEENSTANKQAWPSRMLGYPSPKHLPLVNFRG